MFAGVIAFKRPLISKHYCKKRSHHKEKNSVTVFGDGCEFALLWLLLCNTYKYYIIVVYIWN